jgi:hypothetical protein
MPHFKCTACKTRLYSPAVPADPVGDLCPGCGSLLEPVGELSEIVGFRATTPRDKTGDGAVPGTHQRIVGRVDDLMARRQATLARDRLDAERWLDDGGSFSPEAVAEAVAEAMAPPTPKENS